MSELTPERIRDAAEVVRLVNEAVGRERDAAQYGSSLDTYALTLREKRVDELTDEVIEALNLSVIANMQIVNRTVRHLIARYPALAEGVGDE